MLRLVMKFLLSGISVVGTAGTWDISMSRAETSRIAYTPLPIVTTASGSLTATESSEARRYTTTAQIICITASGKTDERDELIGKLYNGSATMDDIDAVTEKLGRDIGKVYGWDFPDKRLEERTKDRRER